MIGIKELVIKQVATAILNSIPPDVLLQGADKLLDTIEDLVEKSDTRVDDAVVLPLLKLLRAAFSIPDND